MRALIVLNEHPLGSHPDVYEAFDALTDEGVLSGYDVIPYLTLRSSGVSEREIGRLVADAVRNDGHDLVIWMHTGTLEMAPSVLEGVLSAPHRPRMVYWEGDSYHPFRKPLPKQALAIMRRCHEVFVPCGGPMLKTMASAGVKSVRYAPSCASGTRFPHTWRAEEAHEFDIVVVGNKVSSRIPFKTMPGARYRARIVDRLMKRYGSRVAVFGSGWHGPSAQGPCSFDEQVAVYRSSLMTVGVNNSTYPYVFSNRLPVSLACGIPMLYRANPGFGEVFSAELQDRFFADETELLAGIDRLLSADAATLERMSLANRHFFETNLSRNAVSRFVVSSAAPSLQGDDAERPAWQSIPVLLRGDHAERARGGWGGTRCT